MFMDLRFRFLGHFCLLVPVSVHALCSGMDLNLDMKPFSFYKMTWPSIWVCGWVWGLAMPTLMPFYEHLVLPLPFPAHLFPLCPNSSIYSALLSSSPPKPPLETQGDSAVFSNPRDVKKLDWGSGGIQKVGLPWLPVRIIHSPQHIKRYFASGICTSDQ